ncbi:hypothetical protein L484_001722 [Morus notabilis]|uniref:BUB1 N-terminal domain-containing protein n=1 Tax=Morus notabilis TaxID=981085 RepID=W9QNB8_9ROSA|nr:uncharacterized protein LOC21385315 [Morus notabilis]EXB44552.1 hypothetical protein L484_001722 [Morus notabilis]
MANKDLFASIVSDIKTYPGEDPLLPWIRGIRKLNHSLPPQLLKEKLPRFLQKCTQTFESDRRYRNDSRYLRVWLQLMDFVDDPRALLKAMESNGIGTKHSLFYRAYALYYEKKKKFEDAEKMYYLGIQNLAEPVDELQQSYEQFLSRIQRRKNQTTQRLEKLTKGKTEENKENECGVMGRPGSALHDQMPANEKHARTNKISEGSSQPLIESNHTDALAPRKKQQATAERASDKSKMFCSDDTVVGKFVGAAIRKSETEDACHHGLLDPTVNMKEAMNAINSMFSEPLEVAPVGRRRKQPQNDGNSDNAFQVFIDENLDGLVKPADQKDEKSFPLPQHRVGNQQVHQEPLSIFIDDEENDRTEDGNPAEDCFEKGDICNSREDDRSASHGNVFVFPSPKDLPSESSDDMGLEVSSRPRFREDTVVRRFVGSTILDESVAENVCHHGLVEPTINLKEAMEDINNMFGKPIDFVRTKRSKKQDKAPDVKNNFGGFTILPDDDMEHKPVKSMPKASGKSRGCDLYEPTMFTKEAIDDINKMFGMPLDF